MCINNGSLWREMSHGIRIRKEGWTDLTTGAQFHSQHWNLGPIYLSALHGALLGSCSKVPETCLTISFQHQGRRSSPRSCIWRWELSCKCFAQCPPWSFLSVSRTASPLLLGGDDLRNVSEGHTHLPGGYSTYFFQWALLSLWPNGREQGVSTNLPQVFASRKHNYL